MARTLVVSLSGFSLSGLVSRDLQEFVWFRPALASPRFVAPGTISDFVVGNCLEQLCIPVVVQIHEHVVPKRVDRLS